MAIRRRIPPPLLVLDPPSTTASPRHPPSLSTPPAEYASPTSCPTMELPCLPTRGPWTPCPPPSCATTPSSLSSPPRMLPCSAAPSSPHASTFAPGRAAEGFIPTGQEGNFSHFLIFSLSLCLQCLVNISCSRGCCYYLFISDKLNKELCLPLELKILRIWTVYGA